MTILFTGGNANYIIEDVRVLVDWSHLFTNRFLRHDNILIDETHRTYETEYLNEFGEEQL